jgi:hypothetical protein
VTVGGGRQGQISRDMALQGRKRSLATQMVVPPVHTQLALELDVLIDLWPRGQSRARIAKGE